MAAPKPPTPQGISALLRKAGHTRAVIGVQGGNSGYQVEQCRTRAGAVKVRQYFYLGGMPDARYREMLRKYAAAIEVAGWSAEVYTYHLIVIATDATVTPGKAG